MEKTSGSYKTRWVVKDDRIYAVRVLLDAATSSKPIGVMKLEVFPDEFTKGIYQSEYLNNGVVLTDKENHVMKKQAVADDNLEKEIATAIETGREPGFYQTGRGMLQFQKN